MWLKNALNSTWNWQFNDSESSIESEIYSTHANICYDLWTILSQMHDQLSQFKVSTFLVIFFFLIRISSAISCQVRTNSNTARVFYGKIAESLVLNSNFSNFSNLFFFLCVHANEFTCFEEANLCFGLKRVSIERTIYNEELIEMSNICKDHMFLWSSFGVEKTRSWLICAVAKVMLRIECLITFSKWLEKGQWNLGRSMWCYTGVEQCLDQFSASLASIAIERKLRSRKTGNSAQKPLSRTKIAKPDFDGKKSHSNAIYVFYFPTTMARIVIVLQVCFCRCRQHLSLAIFNEYFDPIETNMLLSNHMEEYDGDE